MLKMPVLLGALLFSSAAYSTTLTLSPVPATAAVGEVVRFDLIVSGLGDEVAPSLGAFDFELAYDSNLLALDSLVFGAGAGSQLDLAGFGSLQYFDVDTLGTLILGEVSFDDAALLDSAQQGSFSLAQFFFTTLAAGEAHLQFSTVLLADSLGIELAVDSLHDATLEVTAVPLPGALLLFGSGLLGFAPFARRRARGALS